MRKLFAIPTLVIAAGAMIGLPAVAQQEDLAGKFRQLRELLRSPNMYRSASGAPGPEYWQQQADYDIEARLDEESKRIIATETITYTNNSPDTLRYLWVQLDQNRFKNDSLARRSETSSQAGSRRDRAGDGDSLSFSALRRNQALTEKEHGFEIQSVTDGRGEPLPYTINDTMMRIDLPRALRSGGSVRFTIDWEHNIIDEEAIGGRGGYEHFEDDDTYIYGLAQWFPRMAAYTDYSGWANKQFLGRGEFTLEFGDYDVSITVPEDHIVAASGELQNPRDVLTPTQRDRFEQARDADKPMFIVTPEEAAANESEKLTGEKTWRFRAENVRDFAWSSSRKYIWDAMGYDQSDIGGPFVMAMSFYPNEAEPIWSMYSTHSVVHTMDVYNRFAFPYPYPTAQSVNSWERGGMEYPMITFNGYRPSADEKTGEITYSRGIKYGLIGVIIHEIGHIYFPMVVNSDERRWTWMDEGLNTFLEYQAELEWEENYPAFRGKANVLDYIPSYMTSSPQVPIMTQSDSVLQFGPNAYSKPAAALTILRETVMGRELFDHAFKEYATRWQFKRPTPEDFFRTMEDASAVDLDWFWRGWFFTTDHVDMALTSVREYQVSTQDPDVEFPLERTRDQAAEPEPIGQRRNREEGRETYVERNPELKDFYNENDKYTVSNKDRNRYMSFRDGLEDWEREVLDEALERQDYIYFVDFQNKGGLVMPLPLRFTYMDGTQEEVMIPAEIWRRDPEQVTKLFILPKQVQSIELDPHHEIADADYSNNAYPPRIAQSRLELYKRSGSSRNLMADMLTELRQTDKSDMDTDGGTQVPLQQSGGNP